MPIVSGGGGGSGGPAAGSYLPVALASGGTLDTTTYNDTIVGSGKFHTLVLANNRGALALARSGDAFPKLLLASTSSGLLSATDGTADPWNSGAVLGVQANAGGTSFAWSLGSFIAGSRDPNVGVVDGTTAALLVGAAYIQTGNGPPGGGGNVGDLYLDAATDAVPSVAPCIYRCTTAGTAGVAVWKPYLQPGSPYHIITSGALPTKTLSSGTADQVSLTRDVETVTPFTGDGTNNAATCAIALSPDNVTFSTLATISIAAALNLTGVLTDNVNVRVPASWYLKLTVAHGTLGTTSYY